MKDKEFIYREILTMLQEIHCYIDYHDLHDFIINCKGSHEYRIGGCFGAGFKIWDRGEYFNFTQYKEDETKESIEWINKHNEALKDICLES